MKPTKEEWNSLYQAAVDFKRSACWEWMYDDNIFGVVDPKTGETAYCCIMGNGGEHFAVAGYLGTEGLSGILGLLSCIPNIVLRMFPPLISDNLAEQI